MKKKVKIVIGGTFYGDYFGEVDERPGYFFGKPKGQGTLKTKEGTYVGEVQLGGQPCGKGTFNYLDGSKYTGDFKSGVWSGKGNLTNEILEKNPKKIIAIEKDEYLSNFLKNKFRNKKNVSIIKLILEQDFQEIKELNFQKVNI